MSISGTFKVKQLNGVVPYGDGWNRRVEIDAEDIEIAETVDADEIIQEYGAEVLLEAIGEDVVIKWLTDNGHTIIEG
ncbi:hypothetical protein EKS35_13965 [Enterobacter hormaechei subsp. steigerwaltii]|uniref:hypothetical protein n=1 Tax=Enterobacter cloacae complex TaxID=354276 RepID=UPI000F834B54|nr:hypothetical protein [Enterobacter hormaechei]RTY44039.1 hypothetical protein EKS35_13965 [Enterobacter hormaechei subsp. steigerwaltii]